MAAIGLLSGASLVLPVLLSPASALGSGPAWTAPASPSTTAPFNECPTIGDDTGCAVLITLEPGGAVQIVSDNTLGPYDGNDDTLVGVLNESGLSIPSIALTSPLDIFGFDGDGMCANSGGYTFGSTWELGGSAVSNACPYGTTGYEGPDTTFTNIAANLETGSVTFPRGLADGASTFFSLENAVSGFDVTVPTLSSFSTGTSKSAIAYGASVTDMATAVGNSAGVPETPQGSVSFSVCGPAATTCSSTADPVATNVPLTGSGTTATAQATYTPPTVGNYCFYAIYTGTNYLTADHAGDLTNGECFTVTPAPLVVTPAPETVSFGQTPPAPTPDYSGFVNGDSPGSLSSPATCTTTATASSPAGSYPSSCSGAAGTNYAVSYRTGTVTVAPTGALVVVAPDATMASGGAVPTVTPMTAPSSGGQPIAAATSVHTGEPWAGSRPLVLGAAAAGLALVGLGLWRRRRLRVPAS